MGIESIANASNPNSKTMNLKLMLQKSTNKLLYAEAEEDFVDFLFSFLVIPLGGVESHLSPNSHVKAINNLYTSATGRIHDKYFKNLDAKNRLLKPNIPHGYISEDHIFSLVEDSLPTYYIIGKSSTNFPKGQGICLKGPRTYKVTDDLTVTPFCITSILASLDKKKILVSDVEEVELQIGLKEGLSILKASLTSTCALTEALLSQILNRKRKREVKRELKREVKREKYESYPWMQILLFCSNIYYKLWWLHFMFLVMFFAFSFCKLLFSIHLNNYSNPL